MSSRTPIAGSSDDPPTAEILLSDLLPDLRRLEPVGRTDPSIFGRALYVASTGGHLAELNRLAGRFATDPDSVWVTFDSQQSRSVLRGRPVRFVPYVSPRDVIGTARAFRRILALMRRERFDVVVSTGAAVALAAFVAARITRVRAVYIESVARVTGPSMTGRMAAALRLARLRTQHGGWATKRWSLQESVLDEFRSVPTADPIPARPRLFVTLGTIRPYRFDAIVDAVLAAGLADEQTVWQLGATRRSDLPGTVFDQLTHEEFVEAASASDVVITHAGVGTVLELLELGMHPVVVPRRAARKEHVDDHQDEIAQYLKTLDIATVLEIGDITAAGVNATAGLRTLSF